MMSINLVRMGRSIPSKRLVAVKIVSVNSSSGKIEHLMITIERQKAASAELSSEQTIKSKISSDKWLEMSK